MIFAFHPDAEEEFFEAIEYYEECQVGLGHDFAVEIQNVLQRSMDFPSAYPLVHDEIRRSLVHRFPYAILYAAEEENVFVVEVMHLCKHPDYWKYRVEQTGCDPFLL